MLQIRCIRFANSIRMGIAVLVFLNILLIYFKSKVIFELENNMISDAVFPFLPKLFNKNFTSLFPDLYFYWQDRYIVQEKFSR